MWTASLISVECAEDIRYREMLLEVMVAETRRGGIFVTKQQLSLAFYTGKTEREEYLRWNPQIGSRTDATRRNRIIFDRLCNWFAVQGRKDDEWPKLGPNEHLLMYF